MIATRIFRLLLLPCSILSCLVSFASAQESSPEVENHPAVKLVREYMRCMLEQDWTKTAELVDVKSLEDLRRDYVKRVQKSATLDQEKEIVSKFQVKTLEDIDKMSGKQFYISYHAVLKEQRPADPEVLKKIRDTMKLRILSLAMENENLAHVLVRTRHATDRANVESLDLISLIKQGNKWYVGLNEQTPKVTPLNAAPATSSAPTAPAAQTPAEKPAATEPARKPAKGTKPR